MIFIGYQGIGKSMLAKKNNNFIDLESSNFQWTDKDGVPCRMVNWYIPYCNIAEDLSRQGHDVFVSSHDVVRNQLRNSTEPVCVVVPSLDLKDEWIKKLEDRYIEYPSHKNYRALMNTADMYEDNITEILDSGFDSLTIHSMNYDLESLILSLVYNIDVNEDIEGYEYKLQKIKTPKFYDHTFKITNFYGT